MVNRILIALALLTTALLIFAATWRDIFPGATQPRYPRTTTANFPIH